MKSNPLLKNMLEELDITGDYNMSDFRGSSKRAAMQYLKTPEGQSAVQMIKSMVAKPFDASKLTSVIKRSKFPSMNAFKMAAIKGGLDIEGQGLDNEGNGNFAVYNDNYTTQGAAISFMDDKFYSVG
jgi:hypothetical protein